MASIATELADAVVAAVNAGSYDYGAITAERRYRVPALDLDDLADLHVLVLPRGWDVESMSRADATEHRSVWLAVMRRVSVSSEDAEIESLLLLIEQIVHRLWQQENRVLTLAGGLTASWVRTEPDVMVPRQDHLNDKNTFTGVVSLHYRLGRPGSQP